MRRSTENGTEKNNEVLDQSEFKIGTKKKFHYVISSTAHRGLVVTEFMSPKMKNKKKKLYNQELADFVARLIFYT
jgi:hypothetical protein